MNKKLLAQSLLNIVQSPVERVRFRTSKTLAAFVEDSGIGTLLGNNVIFNAAHKERVRAWLRADNIDPSTPADAWAGVSRAAALELGPDEKWAGMAVRANRIALKTLSGRPLKLGSESMLLPPGANLECNFKDAVDRVRHDSVIVVENWEVFERIDDLDVDLRPAGDNPLVLWRGGAHASIGAAMSFLDAFDREVWSAPDYDPEGLAIALRLPHLKGVIAPDDDVLRGLLAKSKLQERYSRQLAGAQAVLDQATHTDVCRLWAIVKASHNALPQERLCRSPKPHSGGAPRPPAQ
jgi:hypothetical protein